MECVHGVPITEYCDAHRLTNKERLAGFIQVCGGVQHAHQKGVIHRDIKPSNVLVRCRSAAPCRRSSTSAFAKAISQRLTEHSL